MLLIGLVCCITNLPLVLMVCRRVGWYYCIIKDRDKYWWIKSNLVTKWEVWLCIIIIFLFHWYLLKMSKRNKSISITYCSLISVRCPLFVEFWLFFLFSSASLASAVSAKLQFVTLYKRHKLWSNNSKTIIYGRFQLLDLESAEDFLTK